MFFICHLLLSPNSMDASPTASSSTSTFSFSITISICSPFAFVIFVSLSFFRPCRRSWRSSCSLWKRCDLSLRLLCEVQYVFLLLLLSSPRCLISKFLCVFLRLLLLPLQCFHFLLPLLSSALHLRFLLGATAFFVTTVFLLIFSMISWYLVSNSSFSTSFFSVLFLPSYLITSCFPLKVLSWLLFPDMWSWKLSLHICGHFPCESCRWLRRLYDISRIFSWLICSGFVSHYLLEIWRPFVSEVFFCTSCRVLCTLYHQSIFHPISSFVSPRWVCLCQHLRTRFCDQVHKCVSFAICRLLLDRFVFFFSMWCSVHPSGWSAHSSDWCVGGLPRSWRWCAVRWCVWCESLFVSTSCSTQFQHRVCFRVFAAPMNMELWCVSQISDFSCLHVSLNNIESHLWSSSSLIISVILWLECIDHTFWLSINVMSLFFVFL